MHEILARPENSHEEARRQLINDKLEQILRKSYAIPKKAKILPDDVIYNLGFGTHDANFSIRYKKVFFFEYEHNNFRTVKELQDITFDQLNGL